MKKITPAELAQQYEHIAAVCRINDAKLTRPGCFIRTFGCQQNEADSERYAGLAESMGYEIVDAPEKASLILINTCAVREHAEMRAMSITGQFKHLKAANPDLIIGMCGCMVSQEHRLNQIKGGFPYIDFLLGAGMMHRLPELVHSRMNKDKRSFLLDEPEGCLAEGLPVRRESDIKAWVSIMYGCNNFCTYCVVPHVRGRERSRARADILAEVKELIADGCREITLLGQNVNSYGKDLGSEYDFADLVSEICELDGDFILRFMTSHPKDASQKLIDAMASHEKCARQFHLPLQSGSARVLTAMNRRYTPESYLSTVEALRAAMPDIAISSDIIVGFPGETDEEFAETLAMLERVRFDMVYSFIYSPRALTPAASMDGQISAEVKSARMNALLNCQNAISLERNLAAVGSVQRVLLEGASKSDESMLTGRADSNKLVHIPRAGADALVGRFVDVRITRAETFALFGELAD
ncbi:MAG: tRNA (N6-isopentenyl adenosine(37)-C2)-methylthiotransferase MiaB [Clostridia bacterium]|nr:tRNA (N6-isopentenyl adenosine(37)-C2)-methylthiotransferase MiaB [Clostridia bacterium]